MSNNLPAEILSSMPANWESLFDVDAMADDLSAGAGGTGFNVLSIRGSKFRIKVGDEEHPILNADGDPVPSLEVVILKANPNVSKIWYDKAYVEGDAESPDCFSTDGERPDPQSTSPQAKQCKVCPKSQWGSRITEGGKKAKACGDSRRVAVWVLTPLPDGVMNEEPVLLRIPAVSLKDLAVYGKAMAAKNAPYNRIVTRIKFDLNVSFPKLTYSAVRPVGDSDLPVVAELINDERTEAILSESEFTADTDAPVEDTASVNTTFEEPAVKEPVKAAPAKKKTAAKKPAVKKVEAVAEVVEEATAEEKSLDDDLDSIISDLEGLE